MILSVMREVRNFFVVSQETGLFTISNEILIGFKNNYLVGSYVALTGSIMNNGVYLVKDNLMTIAGTKNEQFNGTIYQLAPPKDFLELVDEIKVNVEKTPQTNVTSYSFGPYSESRATDANGQVSSWKEIYASRLHDFRKMFMNINI